MSNVEWNEDARIVEEDGSLPASLYAPAEASLWFSNGWATLHIDMSLMTPEQRGKVYQAEALLREAGVAFDTGSGYGGRDWALDWSLAGARLKVRPISCLCSAHSQRETLPYVFWQVYRSPSGRVVSYAYCSPESREEDKRQRQSSERPWEPLLQDEGPTSIKEAADA